jgi:subtilisin family serine protease
MSAAPPAAAQPVTWNFNQARIPAAQPQGLYGSGVLVAVIDTWVDFNHPDFGHRVIDEADCVNGKCEDHSYSPDACVHGTHVAGTIASADYGVAPKAEILAVQVLSYDSMSGDCSGSTSAVAAGINFAVAHGAKVINMSLGDLVPLLLQDSGVTAAVRAAAAAGVVVVIAAGNSGLPVTDNYGSDALLVAATGPNGALASYSDSGGSVALAAPGGDSGSAGCAPSNCILSTEPGGKYGLLEGTSMAAPHVAGAAALLIAQDPHRGRADVVNSLESTARPLSGAGHGLLDAEAALSLRPTPGPATTTSRPSGTTTSSTGGSVTGQSVGGQSGRATGSTHAKPAKTTGSKKSKTLGTTEGSTGSASASPPLATGSAGSHHHHIPAWAALLGSLALGLVGSATFLAARARRRTVPSASHP